MNGNVGSAVERGLKRAGRDVRATGRENVRETAEWGETIIFAVPFGAVDDAVQTMSDTVNGKCSSRDPQRWTFRDDGVISSRIGATGAPASGACRTKLYEGVHLMPFHLWSSAPFYP